MKERIRKRNNFGTTKSKTTWDFTSIGQGIQVNESDDAIFLETQYTRDFIKKKRIEHTGRMALSPFKSDYRKFSDARMRYTGGTIGGTVKADHRHLYCGSDSLYSVRGFSQPARFDYLFTRLMSETQPFRRSEYSIFVQAREMLELASLFSLRASSFLEFGANAYLNYKMGWAPFLKDMEYIGKIMEDHQERVKELLHMAEKGWYSRKKVRLSTRTMSDKSGPTPVMTAPYPAWVRCNFKSRVKSTINGSIRWNLAPGAWRFFEELEAENGIYNLALKKMLGIEKPSPQDVWNIIPFSWLIDYFVKINDFLGSLYWSTLFEVEEASLTRRTEWTGECSPVSETNTLGHVDKLTGRRVLVERIIMDKSAVHQIQFSGIDLLSAGHWATIAALIVKFRSSRPVIDTGPQ